MEKRDYWQKVSFNHMQEMRIAKSRGLFPKREGWRNVVEHQIVEAEAFDVLAEALNISAREREAGYLACLVHDVEKRHEVELTQKIGAGAYEISRREQAELLKSNRYSQEVVRLTLSVGGGSLVDLLEDPKAEVLRVREDIDLTTLAVHYVDDIVRNNDIVFLNERIDYLESNPLYREANEQGRVIFAGRTYSEVQREVSRQIEERFAQKIGAFEPERLPEWIKGKIFERIEFMQIESVLTSCGNAALAVHDELGEAGKQDAGTNRFGETALLGDVRCEEAVLEVLRKSDLNIKVISEEHGEVRIGSGEPEYLAVLDGIDGSFQYKRDVQDADRRYGTMFAIYKGADPRYLDYIAGMIAEHPTKRLFVGVKSKGAYVVEDGKRTRIRTSGKRSLDRDLRIFAGEPSTYHGVKYEARLRQFNPTHPKASSRCYADLASGVVDAVCEVTFKNNLEKAGAYPIVVEAGGVMICDDGEDLGNKKYLEYAQEPDDFRQIISAASLQLATSLLRLVK